MKYLLGLMILLPMGVFGQFVDAFYDGDFISNPEWQGDTAYFQVNQVQELWLNAPASSGTTYLTTPSIAIDSGHWHFDIRLAFNPSSSNYALVYLVCDRAILADSVNGYYVKIGGTEDEISLWRQQGTEHNKIIDGVDDYLDQNNNHIRVELTRSSSGTWTLWSDSSLTGLMELQGTVMDQTITASHYFGIKCVFTATRSDKFFFDNFEVNGTAFPDTLAPVLERAEALSKDSVQLWFNERLSNQQALNPSAYSLLRGAEHPDIVHFQDSLQRSVILRFERGMPMGKKHLLSITGVTDPAGNALNTTTSVQHVDLVPASFGDIIINEIMADPEPPKGLPAAEYVELFNRSEHFIALDGLHFADANGEAHYSGPMHIGPRAYIVLCAIEDSSIFEEVPTLCPVKNFPALNNGGDDLSIHINGVLLDQVHYERSWYRDEEKDDGGYSLERINPDHPCSNAQNWIASQSPLGVSPGTRNSVFNANAGKPAPRVVGFSFEGKSTIRIQFNSPLDGVSVSPDRFQLEPLIMISSTTYSPEAMSCLINLTSDVKVGNPYVLRISGLTGCLGQIIDTALRVAIGKSARPFDLVFSEIRPVPEGGGSLPPVEYVEVYNRSGSVLSTHGLRLSDRSDGVSLPYTLIWPEAYIILAEKEHTATFDPLSLLALGRLPSLNNADDELFIHRYDTLIDKLGYDADWFHRSRPASEGWALERISNDDLCGTHRNWTSSKAEARGTPGEANQHSLEDELQPQGKMILPALDTLQIEFNIRLDSTALVHCKILDRHYEATFLNAEDRVVVGLADALPIGHSYQVSIEAKACDGKGFITTDWIYIPTEGDIVINEVLFNPRDQGTDYVEVYNNSNQTINLQGWFLAAWDNNGSLTPHTLSDTSLVLASGAYLAFHENEQDVLSNYPFSSSFRLHEINLPNYPNDQGSVVLQSPWNEVMDHFNYDASMHFSLIHDQNGVALERIHPSLPTENPENWLSAASTENYGTPGYQNSQFKDINAQAGRVTLLNATISPDGDGKDDAIILNYRLDTSGYQLNAVIYTDDGVEIKRLASNQLIGIEGQLIWDGIADDGRLAQSGIHILLFDVFHVNGKRERYKLPFVVAFY